MGPGRDAVIAALPWYDLPELAVWTDRMWDGLRARLELAGVPDTLDRQVPHADLLERHDLLLSQTCSLEAGTSPHPFHLVATPCYAVPGCVGPTYRSVVVAPGPLPDRGAVRPAMSEPRAFTGCVSLRGWLAARPQLEVGPTTWTGSHRASLQALQEGRADLAAIDCVTLALLAVHAPALVEGLQRIGHSEPRPAPPFITGRSAWVQPVREALLGWVDDPASQPVRQALHLHGVGVVPRAAYGA